MYSGASVPGSRADAAPAGGVADHAAPASAGGGNGAVAEPAASAGSAAGAEAAGGASGVTVGLPPCGARSPSASRSRRSSSRMRASCSRTWRSRSCWRCSTVRVSAGAACAVAREGNAAAISAMAADLFTRASYRRGYARASRIARTDCGGRPIAARSPATTIGRSMRIGSRTSASIHSASVSDFPAYRAL
jgi:hypothetical protein